MKNSESGSSSLIIVYFDFRELICKVLLLATEGLTTANDADDDLTSFGIKTFPVSSGLKGFSLLSSAIALGGIIFFLPFF